MSFGSQSIPCAPMPGASTSPTAPGVQPIGPFLGSAGDASSRHSRNGDGLGVFERCRGASGRALISKRTSVDATKIIGSRLGSSNACPLRAGFCPTGNSRMAATRKLPVVLLCRRRSRLCRRAHQIYDSRHPALSRGAYRDRHETWGGDAMDVEVPLTSGAEADGEIVWS